MILAIRNLHNGDSTWIESMPVKETFLGETVWEGEVHAFDLNGHPTASRCYAWSHALNDSENRRFVGVFSNGRVESPEAAVRAAIVQEQQQ